MATSKRVVERDANRAKVAAVKIDAMYVRHGVAQREKLNTSWVNEIYKDFEPDKFEMPTVNKCGERYWIVDGQHRVAALKQWLGEWAGQTIQCRVYENLTEKEEADLFDILNRRKAVSAFDKFRVRLTRELEEETNIDAVVRLKGLKISQNKKGRAEGSISCISTLTRVYRTGMDNLARDLEIVHHSFGDTGLDADIIGGIGLVVGRYNGQLDDKRAISALSSVRGGVNAIRARAEKLRQQMGVAKTQCIAAAAVEAINRGKGVKKLPSWWKHDAQ